MLLCVVDRSSPEYPVCWENEELEGKGGRVGRPHHPWEAMPSLASADLLSQEGVPAATTGKYFHSHRHAHKFTREEMQKASSSTKKTRWLEILGKDISVPEFYVIKLGQIYVLIGMKMKSSSTSNFTQRGQEDAVVLLFSLQKDLVHK